MTKVERYTRPLRSWRATPVRMWMALVVGAVVLASCSPDEGVRTDGVTNVDVGVSTDHGAGAVQDVNLRGPGTVNVTVNGIRFTNGLAGSVGTGNLNPFLRIQDNGPQQGFNSDAAKPYAQTKQGSWTHSLQLNRIPVIGLSGTGYREFAFDANESTAEFKMDAFDVYVCNIVASTGWDDIAQLDAAKTANQCRTVASVGNHSLLMTSEFSSGSGNSSDYRILIPESLFQTQISLFGAGDQCSYAGPLAPSCGLWVIVYSRMSDTESGFEEFSTVERPYLNVSKTVNVALTRTYNWQISKSVAPQTITQFDGQSTNATWQVNVTPGSPAYTDGATSVTGVITISNPSGFAVSVKSVSDAVDDGTFGTAVVTSCTGGAIPTSGAPRTLANGGSFTCNYEMTVIPNTTSGPHLNRATVTIAAAIAGEDDAIFKGDAEFDFADATVTSVNQNPNVYDNNNAAGESLLGTASTGTFSYVVAYACGSSRTVSNVARIDLAPTGNATNDPTATATLTINCLDLTVSKRANTSVNRTYKWSISKSATPTSWALFNGDNGTTRYTVTATPNGYDDTGHAVSGVITIQNPNAVSVYLQSVSDALTGGINAPVTCPNGGGPATVFAYELAAGATLECSYAVALPDATNRTNTATVVAKPTSTGTSKNFTGTAAVTPGSATPTETNRIVNITDNFNGGGAVSLGTATWGSEGNTTPGSATVFNPTHQFSCGTTGGSFTNVATITETGQSANATVVLTCHSLTTTKTVVPKYQRAWTWSVTKVIDPNDLNLTLAKNEAYSADYTVVYTPSAPVESNFRVDGTIKVQNSAPIAAIITGVSDLISGSGETPEPSCGVTFPYTLAANSDLDCTYTQSLANKTTSRTNTATGTRQARSYTYELVGSNNGTVNYASSAVSITFPTAPTEAVNECVTVDDTHVSGAIVTGTKCADNSVTLRTFRYPHTFDTSVCGPYTVPNTASFTTTAGTSGSVSNTATAATGSASLTVNVTVNCLEGCTLTQGYWKTHNDNFKGGASKKADPAWELIGATKELTGFFTATTAAYPTTYPSAGPNVPPFTWFTVFWTAPQGNPYYNLAHQYQAAKLNSLNSADDAVVATALGQAEDWLDSYGPSTPWTKQQKKTMLDWAGLFGSYNEGKIGPGHCDEDNTSRLAAAD